MNKVRVLKIVFFIVTMCLTAAILVSCGSFGGTTTNENKKNPGTSGGEVTEEKISMSQAVQNYKAKEMKRSDIEADATLGIFTANGGNGEYKVSNVGAKLNLTRVERGDKCYDKASLTRGEVSDDVVGILSMVKDYCEGNAGLIGQATYIVLKEEQKEKMRNFAPYLAYVQAFLQGKIICNAEAGYEAEDSVNLKAGYKYNISNSETKEGDVWCASGMNTLATAIPGKLTEEKIKSLFIDPILQIVATSAGTDSASDRVTSDGEAKYDIKPDIGTEKTAIIDLLRKMFGLLDVEIGENAINNLFTKINTWVTVDNDSSIKVLVGSDKLPVSTKYNVKVTVNLPVREFKDTIIGLKEYGLPEDVASLINTLITAVNLYICGANGETDKVGFTLGLNVTESYKYAEKDCVISDSTSDMFISAEEDKDGRLELDEVFNKLTVEQVDKYISEVLKTFNEEKAEEIKGLIKEKIKDKADINLYTLGREVVSVLRGQKKADEALKGAIDRIIEAVLKGEIKIDLGEKNGTADDVTE